MVEEGRRNDSHRPGNRCVIELGGARCPILRAGLARDQVGNVVANR